MEKKKNQKNNVPKAKRLEPEKQEIPKSIYEKNDNIYIMVNAKPNSKLNSIIG
jgi:CMP-N-acetylneuraminic acid synthetase